MIFVVGTFSAVILPQELFINHSQKTQLYCPNKKIVDHNLKNNFPKREMVKRYICFAIFNRPSRPGTVFTKLPEQMFFI